MLNAALKDQQDANVKKAVRRIARRKVAPTTLEGQLAEIIVEHYANELPRNKNRARRNGSGSPLSAWMEGAPARCQSKIMAVTQGESRYPWTTLAASIEELAKRIAGRYDITLVQRAFLVTHIALRYRGRPSSNGWLMGTMGTQKTPLYSSEKSFWESSDFLSNTIEKLGLCPAYMPLRAILDRRITDILLLAQLNEQVKKSTKLH